MIKYVLPANDKVHKRQYRVNGFKKTASKEIIPDLKIYVAEYFKNHEVDLKYPSMPCLWASQPLASGSRTRTSTWWRSLAKVGALWI